MKPVNCLIISVGMLLFAGLSGCRSPYYADKGAALGGLAGGLTGAAIRQP